MDKAHQLELLKIGVHGNQRSCVLLNAIQSNRNEPTIKKLLDDYKFHTEDPLLHQGTFLGFAYITLVLLWEQVKKDDEKRTLVIGDIDFNFSAIRKNSGPRKFESKNDYLRVLRNGLSHARVEIKDQIFVFTDIDRRIEKEDTRIEISWVNLAKLSEATMWSSFKHLQN